MNPIDLISASAGTGKTWTLGKELLDAISAGIGADRVMAVTFTRAAAAELSARSRQRLLEHNLREEAQRLQLAHIGTVHGVFGGLLGEHAIASGRSPATNVIPEGAASALFRIAADAAIRTHADGIDRISQRFGHGARRDATDWREHVRRVVDLARENGIGAKELDASADRSLGQLMPLLDAPGDAAQLDRDLADALAAVIQQGPDGTKTTEESLVKCRECQRDLQQGRLGWDGWVRLAGLKGAKASEARFADLRAAAVKVLSHPRLHADINAYVRGIFACACEALDAYEAYKRPRGMMDFADQEAEALRLLDDQIVAGRIADETALLMVDEFQDTSPMQLSLFLRMAAIVRQSLWVGDAKQAIYGFRGTDPALVAAVARILPQATGGARRPPLSDMRRSRPALVAFTNDVFSRAFPKHGIPAQDVLVNAVRPEFSGDHPALHVWRLQGGQQDEAHAALAAGVVRMLREAAAWPVADRDTGDIRPLRGGDIAILMRSNDACAAVASQLAAQGVKVALSRPGLLARAECVLARAALRWLSDPTDTIALAELAHLSEGDSEAPDWLERALRDGGWSLAQGSDTKALESLREALARLTPSEALDAAIAAINLPQRLRRFGDATARLAALDALRGLARNYEDEMRAARLPATAAGLAAWLAEQEGAEEPASPDRDAVHVLTVHRSKGLEWPVVVLAQLDKDADARLFDSPVAMSDLPEPDPSAPLAGRWIRFWPWPFGQSKKVALADRAAASPTGLSATADRNSEEVRLLYVAMTRARDHLVLAPREKATKSSTQGTLGVSWLLKLEDGAPDLQASSEGQVRVGGAAHKCSEWSLVGVDPAVDPARHVVAPLLPAPADLNVLPRVLNPSALPPADPIQPRVIRLGGRLALTGTPDMTDLGDALHGVFASDDPSRSQRERMDRADGLLKRWDIAALAAQDVIAAADRLRASIENLWPGANVHREWPVSAMLGEQRLEGRIDMIVEHEGGFAIIDHKSFPGGAEHWPARCGKYRPQLEAYASALTAATRKPVTGLYLHLPVAGVLLAIEGD